MWAKQILRSGTPKPKHCGLNKYCDGHVVFRDVPERDVGDGHVVLLDVPERDVGDGHVVLRDVPERDVGDGNVVLQDVPERDVGDGHVVLRDVLEGDVGDGHVVLRDVPEGDVGDGHVVLRGPDGVRALHRVQLDVVTRNKYSYYLANHIYNLEFLFLSGPTTKRSGGGDSSIPKQEQCFLIKCIIC